MRIITRKYKVYKFAELQKSVQDKVINEEIKFIMEATPYESMSPDMQRAVDKAESMRTPWFAGNYIWDYCKDEIMESVDSREYLINGNVSP